MILYLGTSSLIKLYTEEKQSELLRTWVRAAEAVATCRVAYTEVVSALENRFRKKDISKEHYNTLMRTFTRDWPHFVSIDFDEIETGRLVKKYKIKRFNAIHLSAATLIKKGRPDLSLFFSSADAALNAAAEKEGLHILHFK